MKAVALIPAAGSGSRAGAEDKLFRPIAGGECALARVFGLFAACKEVGSAVVAAREEDFPRIRALAQAAALPVTLVRGGETRADSVRAALGKADEGARIVLVHDAARPFASAELVAECVSSAEKYGSGIAAIPLRDTVAETDGTVILSTPPRAALRLIQTPQAFRADELRRAFAEAEKAGNAGTGTDFTDESGLYARFIRPPRIVEGARSNLKLTYPEDLMTRRETLTGIGFDAHPLKEGRELVLGGVVIPSALGLDGHSDADALTHAIMDALLSAAHLGDIGELFPPSDPKYLGAHSLDLLAETVRRVEGAGFRVRCVSAVVLAERPKLSPYREKMSENLAKVMHISTERVGITATTTEKMGFVGRGEGIAAQAVATIGTEDD